MQGVPAHGVARGVEQVDERRGGRRRRRGRRVVGVVEGGDEVREEGGVVAPAGLEEEFARRGALYDVSCFSPSSDFLLFLCCAIGEIGKGEGRAGKGGGGGEKKANEPRRS